VRESDLAKGSKDFLSFQGSLKNPSAAAVC
jgi:hypothetical protein